MSPEAEKAFAHLKLGKVAVLHLKKSPEHMKQLGITDADVDEQLERLEKVRPTAAFAHYRTKREPARA